MINFYYKLLGVLFLCLSKIKNSITGYNSPKPFLVTEIDRCINYDISVVENWIKHLENYIGDRKYILDKNILELCPGSDLGTGYYLLFNGIKKYHSFDKNNLIASLPKNFYQSMLKYLENYPDNTNLDRIKDLVNNQNNGLINHIVNSEFDLLSSFNSDSIDIVFSQAAFEHFDDFDKTVKQLSQIVKSGAILVSEVDLGTHTRWIRDKDPNNIYRYSDRFYNIFHYEGYPSRMRPYQYKEILKENGWINIEIIPLSTINTLTANDRKYFNHRFQDKINQMEYISFMLLATKK